MNWLGRFEANWLAAYATARTRPTWRTGRHAVLLAVLTGWLVLGTLPSARAHADLMGFIRHAVRVEVGPTNIDVTVELTFYEIPSVTERQRMDANGDKRIDAAEAGTYIESLAETLADGIRLEVDGRALEVVALRDPALDLMGVDRVSPAHHLLRLAWFARTPAGLGPGSRLVFEDRLWPKTRALDAFEAAGVGGMRVETIAGPKPAGGGAAQGKAAFTRIIRVNAVEKPAGEAGARVGAVTRQTDAPPRPNE
jgi:hypothetical protein